MHTLPAFLVQVAAHLDGCGERKLAHDCRNYAMIAQAEAEVRRTISSGSEKGG